MLMATLKENGTFATEAFAEFLKRMQPKDSSGSASQNSIQTSTKKGGPSVFTADECISSSGLSSGAGSASGSESALLSPRNFMAGSATLEDLLAANASMEAGSGDEEEESEEKLPPGLLHKGELMTSNLGASYMAEARSKKRGRTVLTPMQTRILCQVLEKTYFPTSLQREQLSCMLGVPQRTIQIWFQNQRQKAKHTGTGSGNNSSSNLPGQSSVSMNNPVPSRRSLNGQNSLLDLGGLLSRTPQGALLQLANSNVSGGSSSSAVFGLPGSKNNGGSNNCNNNNFLTGNNVFHVNPYLTQIRFYLSKMSPHMAEEILVLAKKHHNITSFNGLTPTLLGNLVQLYNR